MEQKKDPRKLGITDPMDVLPEETRRSLQRGAEQLIKTRQAARNNAAKRRRKSC